MNIRADSLFVAFVFAAVPAHAQSHGGDRDDDRRADGQREGERDDHRHAGSIQSLASDLAALGARVGKLEGQIVSVDLVGTYAIAGIQNQLVALIVKSGPGPESASVQRNAAIGSQVFTGTLTLNAHGTGSINATGGGGFLTQGPWTLTPTSSSNSGPFTWTYANGTLATSLNPGNEINFSVGPGGRLLVATIADFNTDDKKADEVLLILTRLQ